MSVSILVTTCDDQEHVREALDSIRMQRTSFELEVLVGCARGNPIWELAVAHDDSRFEAVDTGSESPRDERSVGTELRLLLGRARGDYVARLHSCDLWIRQDKLRLQVEALKAQPDCTICSHDTVLFREDGSQPATHRTLDEGRIDGSELLTVRETLDPSSVVLRRRPPDQYPAWLWETSAVDASIHTFEGLAGVIHVGVRAGASRVREGVRSGEDRLGCLVERAAIFERLCAIVPSRFLDQLEYASSKVRALLTVEEVVPFDSCVLVLSSGDQDLVELGDRIARHFPGDVTGYAGGLPMNGKEAATLLDQAHARGAQYLVVPAASRWWLGQYPELAEPSR